MRLLQFEKAFDAREWEMIRRAGHADIVRREAARAIADKISRDHVLQQTEIEPDKDDPWGGDRARVRFAIGVADKSDAARLEAQLAAARAEGMQIAADMAHRAAGRYMGLDGPCGHVIASSLHDLSRAISEAASKAAKPMVEPV